MVARQDHLDYVLDRWEKADPWVELTPQSVAALKAHVERTGVGPRVLLRGRDYLPAGVKFGTIESWLSGATKKAKASHLETVLELWRALPDNPYIPITDAMVRELETLLEATGVSVTLVLRTAPDAPVELQADDVSRWRTRRVGSVRKADFEFVIERYKAIRQTQLGGGSG